MRVELRRGGDGQRRSHGGVLGADGRDGPCGKAVVLLGGRQEDVVGRRGGEGGRVQRVVAHVAQV